MVLLCYVNYVCYLKSAPHHILKLTVIMSNLSAVIKVLFSLTTNIILFSLSTFCTIKQNLLTAFQWLTYLYFCRHGYSHQDCHPSSQSVNSWHSWLQSVGQQPVQPVGEESLQPGGEQPVIIMHKTDFG